jgi:hypothetical protein
MTHLFDPLVIRDIAFANRVLVSPMCEYSSTDGFANDWHVVHLGSPEGERSKPWELGRQVHWLIIQLVHNAASRLGDAPKCLRSQLTIEIRNAHQSQVMSALVAIRSGNILGDTCGNKFA